MPTHSSTSIKESLGFLKAGGLSDEAVNLFCDMASESEKLPHQIMFDYVNRAVAARNVAFCSQMFDRVKVLTSEIRREQEAIQRLKESVT